MINNLKLKQNPEGFCFGIDAVLLANFVKDKYGIEIELDEVISKRIYGFKKWD